MEKIISNPGLQHLAEKFFMNLDVEDLKICTEINQSCKQILEDAMFWLRKIGGLSKESQKDWIKIIQSVKNSNYEKVIVSFLQWNLKKEVVEVDLSCFWFKKFRNFSEENQKDWIKVIESEKNSEKEKAIMSYLQWKLKNHNIEHSTKFEVFQWKTKTIGSKLLNQRRILEKKMLSCLICNETLGKEHQWIFHAIPVWESKMTLGRKYMKSVPSWCRSYYLLKILKL